MEWSLKQYQWSSLTPDNQHKQTKNTAQNSEDHYSRAPCKWGQNSRDFGEGILVLKIFSISDAVILQNYN